MASISGRVFEETAVIGNVPVGLFDSKGKQLTVIRAGGDGKFTFNKLQKGTYKLKAQNKATKAKGELEVTVKEMEQVTDLELVMKLPPKKVLSEGMLIPA